MTTSSLSDSANSSSSPSPKTNDEGVDMISVRPMPVPASQDNPTPSSRSEANSGEFRLLDMASTIRSGPPSALDDLNMCNVQQTIPHELSAKNSEQWIMNNGHVTSAVGIHRKSFNIDSLLAKSQTGEQEKDRFVNSPDSNDCYNDDRRDYASSPEGHNIR